MNCRPLMLLSLLLGLASCYKDEVEIAALTTNPFDADYTGPDVFVFDSTYLEEVLIGTPPNVITVSMQVVEFHSRAELLSANAHYSVQVTDPDVFDPVQVSPENGQPHRFKYYRTGADPDPGVERCYVMRLSNDLAVATPQTICCTLTP